MNGVNYPLNDNFDKIGYGSTLVLMTLGDKVYYILLGPILIALLRVFVKKCKPRFLNFRYSPFKKIYAYFQNQDQSIRWNGFIGFFSANYLLMVTAIMLQIKNSKFSSDDQWQEVFSTYCNIPLAMFVFIFPIFIVRLYEVRLERVDSLPDPMIGMTSLELRQIYGTADLSYILDEVYTESKHKKFENTYAILIEGFALKRLGKWPAILIPFFGMIKDVVLIAVIMGFMD